MSAKTVKVTINGRAIAVPPGTLLTDAARAAEVHIPVFCSHPRLPPLGACRICVVEVGMPRRDRDGSPVLGADGSPEIAWMPKPQTACTTTVADGMVVATESPGAVRARKGVMEFLLVNHPLDCPVCDEGGECQLQDLAFAFGHDFSRMDEAKRTFVSEDLGPVVKKEANRCIVCMRCVRYCDEIMGEDALTAHQRGVRTEISSFDRQPLECEQCGNCIEVCPVGALTALPYRFKARPWDLRQHVTICPWCSNGCSVRLGVRGTEILRARGTEHRGVNQEYLCARGRFGYSFVSAAERLTGPLLRLGGALAPAGFDEAVAFTASRLREIAARHGPGSIAFLGGEKLTVEEQYLFQKLARTLGTSHVDARTRLTAPLPGDAILKATGGGRPALSLEELGSAGEVLVLGDDLQGEGPFAQAVLIRGQHQNGLHLTVAHPRRVKLARPKFRGEWLALRPGGEVALLNALARAALDLGEPQGMPPGVAAGLPALRQALAAWTPEKVERVTGIEPAAVAAAARRLRETPRKAIVFGRALVEHPQAAALLQAVENLAWLTGALTAERSFVMYVGPHSGTQGALDMGLVPDRLPGYLDPADAAARAPFEKQWGVALPSAPGMTAPEILKAAAGGRVRALWIAGDNWLRSAPDRALAEQALAGAELVIVSELFLTETARAAHVVFPAVSFAEKEGVVVNCERRLQRTARALSPLRGARTDRETFQAVARALGAGWSYRGAEDVYREIARLVPGYRGTGWGTMLPLGPRWASDGAAAVAGSLAPVADAQAGPGVLAGDGLWLLSGGVLFQQGSLSHRVELLQKLAKGARAFFGAGELQRLGLAEGDAVVLEGPAGSLTLPAAVDDSVPPGAVFVPYAYPEVQVNRLGAPAGAGLRVKARRAEVTARVGA
ncbi:MAG: NADH-quinone oxidoreductase subunit NuoG [Candidatus Eisenbacteria bacterium]|nr:NADH-quinone oxidoreductase subunit NuoG [Candidatus Eisenbacteria bacterium]